VAIADVTADVDLLPAPLRTAAARVACFPPPAMASCSRQPVSSWPPSRPHDRELGELVDRVDARLRLAMMLPAPALAAYRDQLSAALEPGRLARDAVSVGRLDYSVTVARGP
jgi:hypothetical protein